MRSSGKVAYPVFVCVWRAVCFCVCIECHLGVQHDDTVTERLGVIVEKMNDFGLSPILVITRADELDGEEERTNTINVFASKSGVSHDHICTLPQ